MIEIMNVKVTFSPHLSSVGAPGQQSRLSEGVDLIRDPPRDISFMFFSLPPPLHSVSAAFSFLILPLRGVSVGVGV